MIAFPQGLPEWDLVRQALEGTEELAGTSVSAKYALTFLTCDMYDALSAKSALTCLICDIYDALSVLEQCAAVPPSVARPVRFVHVHGTCSFMRLLSACTSHQCALRQSCPAKLLLCARLLTYQDCIC